MASQYSKTPQKNKTINYTIIYDGIIFEKQRYGGISRVFSELISRVPDFLDANVEIIISKEWVCNFKPNHNAIQIKNMPRIFFLNKGKYDSWFKSIYTYFKGGIWHSTEYTVPEFKTGPIVCTIHDMIPEKFGDSIPQNYLLKTLPKKKKAIKDSDAIVAVSEATKKDILQIYPEVPESKIHVIHNSYNKDIFFPRNKSRKPFLLYVGGSAKYKGFNVLIDALNKWEARKNYTLIAVGKELTETESKNCDFDFKYIQNVNDDKLAALYSEAAAFIYPSFYEGFGIPLLEAMACHCPIVASRIPSSVEVGTGVPYYFTPGDNLELIDALEKALEKENWQEKMNRTTEITTKFDWSDSAQKLTQLYESLKRR